MRGNTDMGMVSEQTLRESWSFWCLDYDELMLNVLLPQEQHILLTEPVAAVADHMLLQRSARLNAV